MKYIITKDGSITFYSEEYKESYHSVSGAVEESLKKFVEPCKIKELAEKGSVKILDIGFGLGYNIAVALDVALMENRDCKIEIISFEKDVNIFREIEKLNPNIKNYNLIKELVKNFIGNVKNKDFNNKENKITYTKNYVKINLLIGNAIDTIKNITDIKFNAVFLDPFSPPKNPELWTASFFKDIKRLMEKDAILATYSCAGIARENLKKAGFDVKDGPIVGRKSPGTLAFI